ncbi:hypothetical protein METP2_01542 [Methanosarcinales archaeon]|nr:MFS transporter [Candidatus Methanoperedens sp.]CAG0973589.1 hypothetical protein METP2_01542 [Methanosarcinales archaeon]
MKFLERNELLFNFMLVNISSGIAVGMMNFIIPVYALSLNATSAEIGLIKGFTGIGDLLIVLPAGFLIDYFGSKKMYSVSCIFGSLIIISISFATNASFLLQIMLFYGISKTIRTTSNNADFFKHMNTIGASKAGYFKGSITIGSALIGPLIGGIAILAMGYTSYFVLTSAFLLLPLIIISSRLYRENTSQVKPKIFSFIDTSNHYKSLTKNRLLVSATIKNGLNSAFFMTFTTFIIVLAIKDLGLSPGIAAALISIKGVSTLFVVFFGGTYLQKNNNGLYLFAYITTIFSLLLLGIGTDSIALAVASLINGVGTGLITLINFTEVGNIDGEKGKIAGFFSFGNAMGSITGPTLAGMIGDALGVQSIFLAFIVPFGMLAIYTFVENKKHKKQN